MRKLSHGGGALKRGPMMIVHPQTAGVVVVVVVNRLMVLRRTARTGLNGWAHHAGVDCGRRQGCTAEFDLSSPHHCRPHQHRGPGSGQVERPISTTPPESWRTGSLYCILQQSVSKASCAGEWVLEGFIGAGVLTASSTSLRRISRLWVSLYVSSITSEPCCQSCWCSDPPAALEELMTLS